MPSHPPLLIGPPTSAGAVSCFRVLLPAALLLTLAAPLQARGWRRDIAHRPRATLDARDAGHLARLRDRLLAREAPWAAAYEHLRDLAETGRAVPHGQSGWRGQPDRWAALYGREVQNGLVARAKAAVAWLATQGVDPAWRPLPRLPGQATPQGWLRAQAAEAAAIIGGMYDDWPGWRGYAVLNRGIVSGESLLVHAQAWDLLAGLPASLRPPLQEAGERIAALAEDHCFYAPLVGHMHNNHPIRVAAGLVVAGVVRNDHDRYRWWKPWTWDADPADWVRRGERELDPERRGSDLRRQAGSGAWAEGTSYHAYSADLYAPAHWAYVRAGGAAMDPFLSGRLARLSDWSLAIRLPDGRRPAIDNAALSAHVAGAYLVNRLARGSRDADQRRRLGWDWVDQGQPGLRGSRALELLAAWDPDAADLAAIAASGPPGGAAFLAEEGAAVLRAGSGRQAAHALLLAEHDAAREDGFGHEDVDPLAFTLWAEGDAIALDPGYPGWTRVDETRAAGHHNLILVDGEGPPGPRNLLGWRARGADAWLLPADPRTYDGRALDSAAARTEYRGARIARTLTLLGGRALVVEDLVEARRPCDLTALYQAGGGATKPGRATLGALGLSYVTAVQAVPVEVALASTRGPLRLELGRARDALDGAISAGGRDEHATLRGTVRAERVRLLTLVTWGPAGGAALPLPARLLDRPGATALLGVTGSGTTVVAAAQETAGAALVLPAAAGHPRIETDGTTLIVALSQAGQVLAAVAQDATRLEVDAATPLRLARSGAGALRYDP